MEDGPLTLMEDGCPYSIREQSERSILHIPKFNSLNYEKTLFTPDGYCCHRINRM